MEMKDNHTEMEFKNTIIKRMYKKCVLLFILVICLVILLVGAALGKLWALIGYIAICAEQRPLVRLPAATRRSATATLIKAFR